MSTEQAETVTSGKRPLSVFEPLANHVSHFLEQTLKRGLLSTEVDSRVLTPLCQQFALLR